MDRILVLIAADTYAHADKALRSAGENAARPQRLSYGISLAGEPSATDAAAMHDLGLVQYIAPAYNSWQDMPALWRGESYVLIAHTGMRFAPNWDKRLLQCLRRCMPDTPRQAVLSGFLPSPADPVDAVSPVAAEGFDEQGRLCFRHGAPLRYARDPMAAAFLHPAFCFGPAAFFQELAEDKPPLFLAAYRRGWQIYTMNDPAIRTAWEVPVLPVKTPENVGRATGLSRFSSRYHVRLDTRQLSPMARTGIYTPDLTYPMHIPLRVRMQEAWREARTRSANCSPLIVTAYQTLAIPGESLPEEYYSRFLRLAALKNISVLCFADGEMGRRLLPVMPNLMEYKRRYALPIACDITPATELNFLKLSKMHLLLQGREKYLQHSHYVWMDFGYLRYPVYERVAVDWRELCTDKIVLATVNGLPDTSMIIVPQDKLQPLCQEITERCARPLATARLLLQETMLWQMMINDLPEWFTLIERPAAHRLFDKVLTPPEEFFDA